MPEHVLIGRYPHMTRDSIPHTTDLTENVSSLFVFFQRWRTVFKMFSPYFRTLFLI